MAFRAIRNSRNSRWTARLGEIFQENDKDNTGVISVVKMAEIYRFYQVELNTQDVEILAHNGNIKRSDFIEYALETKLLDLTDTSNARKTINNKKKIKKKKDRERKDTGPLLCCLARKKKPERDRVETAFRKLDINGDGYVDWNEFQKGTTLDLEQANRIFNSCDKNGDNKISLEEFRNMANYKKV